MTTEKQYRVFDKYNLECTVPMAPKEVGHYALNGICFQEGRTVATDGRIMVKVPYPEINRDDLPVHLSDHAEGVNGDAFIMPVDQCKNVIKAMPKRATYPILENGTIGIKDNKASVRLTDLENDQNILSTGIDGTFPKTDDIEWPDEKTHMEVTLGLPILEAIVKSAKKALGKTDSPFILFRFQKPEKNGEMLQSIRFEYTITDDGRKVEGVFMPVCSK